MVRSSIPKSVVTHLIFSNIARTLSSSGPAKSHKACKTATAFERASAWPYASDAPGNSTRFSSSFTYTMSKTMPCTSSPVTGEASLYKVMAFTFPACKSAWNWRRWSKSTTTSRRSYARQREVVDAYSLFCVSRLALLHFCMPH